MSWTSPAPGQDGRPVDVPETRSDPGPGLQVRPEGSGEHHHLHLPPGAHVGDRRGLTATGAVTVALVLGALGGLVDVLTGSGLRNAFAVGFIAGCVLAAAKVHREDLVAAVTMPPLVYSGILLVSAGVTSSGAGGSWVTREALELATSLILGAPVLLTATGLALVVAVTRGVAGRRVVNSR